MKRSLLCLVVILMTAFSVNAQCFQNGWSHPQIQGNSLRCAFTLGQVAYVGGDAGVVLKSIDGGANWSFVSINTTTNIFGLYFTDANTGYATSRQGVYKTTDGGINWQFTQLSTSSWMYGVEFVSDSIGLVCGQNGLIYRTTDAGANWTLENSWSNRTLYAMHFPEPLIGYAVGGANNTTVGGKVFKTVDGGLTWTDFTPLNQRITDVYFTSAQVGYCVTDFGRLVTTTDGGANWTVTNLTNQQLLGVYFSTPDSGMVVGVGIPRVTTDGGQTWTQQTVPGYTNTHIDIAMLGNGYHLLVGAAGQIITGDNLMTNAQLRTTAESGNTIYDIIFKDDQHGIACGVGALVMQTSDGGGSWQQDQSWSQGQNYHALVKIDSQTALMAGTGGQIWKTTDWGGSWTQQTTGVTSQFYDMQFLNADTGWVVGNNGIMMRTFDGGTTWNSVSVGTTNDINAVHFRPSGIGWVAGNSGLVYKSTDFGATWTQVFVGNSSNKEAITFFDDSIGYTGGSTGTMYYTHDGGNTWLGASITNGSGVNSILPLSANRAIGVGGFGDHYFTSDTGQTWSELPLLTDNLLYKIYAHDTTIWVTGGEGTILKSGFQGSIELQYSQQVCAGDSLLIGGNWVSLAGIYYDTVIGQCDTIIEYDVTLRNVGQSTSQVDICSGDSLFVGGGYQTISGIYTDTLSTIWGCDSLRSTNLQILPPSGSSMNDTICSGDTLSFFGQPLTIAGVYQNSSLQSYTGCDSTISLDLTVLSTSSGNDPQVTCSPFTWIDGNTYATSNNSATYTLTNAAGCDSVVTLNLTVNTPTAFTDTQTACSSFTWIDGNTYNSNNNTATVTLSNAAGCDSIITLDLTINQPTASTDIQTACGTYTWTNGITYNASNNSATDTFTNASGCDSIVTLDLTVNTIDVTTSVNATTITANASGASYQWLDCDNNLAPINGATSQTYVATANGNYAVEITENGCSDTSTCVSIIGIVIADLPFTGAEMQLYPNPTRSSFFVEFDSKGRSKSIAVYNLLGELIWQQQTSETITELNLGDHKGVFLVRVTTERHDETKRIVIH